LEFHGDPLDHVGREVLGRRLEKNKEENDEEKDFEKGKGKRTKWPK